MTIQLIETADSRESEVAPNPEDQLLTRKFILQGTDDELTARVNVENSLSAYLDGQAFNSYRITPRGALTWDVTASWGKKKTPGTVTLNFDTGDDKVKLTQAPLGAAYYPAYIADYGLSSAVSQILGSGYAVNDILTLQDGTNGVHTVAAQVKVLAVDALGGAWSFAVQTVGDYTATPTNPVSVTGGGGSGCTLFADWKFIGGTPKPTRDYKGAIGIKTHNGQVTAEGIDDEVPAFEFTVNVVFGPNFPLTGAFVQLCNLSAWHVNAFLLQPTISGVALTFNPGELLFKGATGLQKAGGALSGYADFEGEVTLKFASQANIINQTIAGVPGVTKLGWDYLEVIYEEVVLDTDIVPSVKQVNVNKVKYIADLSGLFPLAPTITSFSPGSGLHGVDSTTITGTNFNGVSSVLFNGVAAQFFVNSPTSIVAIVPIAATTGPITVKAAGGSVTSAGNFTVT